MTKNALFTASTSSRTTRLRPLCVAAMVLPLLTGCANQAKSRAFTSPDEAVQTLASVLRAGDTSQLLSIMGPEAKEISSSGDKVADLQRRQRFLELYDQKHSLVAESDDRQTLVVGESDWPFPIPIVKRGKEWYFDAAAGKEEILNRRIGENELSAIQVCKAVCDAQREYALRDPDGDGVRGYARKFASDPGQRNGLFWRAAEGEPLSPLGLLAAAAAKEGYTRRIDGLTPYHGYYYRILESQGPGAPGGAVDYVVNDKMPLGFALVAWPAEYGSSGIMTFIMGPDGDVYQQNLGDETDAIATEMKAFDPGEGWTKAEEPTGKQGESLP
jgi:hypothetical protein